jgi:predicted O-linked N-acetylglucosamine transferase (SPINDLY family)
MDHIKSIASLFNAALQAHLQGDVESAASKYEALLSQNPSHFDALHMLAVIRFELGQFRESHALFDRALKINTTNPHCYYNFGLQFARQARYAEALQQFDKALALKPDHAAAHSDRGSALKELGRYPEGIQALERAIALAPNTPAFWYNRGGLLLLSRAFSSALRDYDKAIELDRKYAAAWVGRGNALHALSQYRDALAAYDQALSLNQDLEAALFGKAGVLGSLKQYGNASQIYATILKRNPDAPYVRGLLLHQKMLACDWRSIERLSDEIKADISNGKRSAEPFGWQAMDSSPERLKRCAEIYCRDKFPVHHERRAQRHVGRERGGKVRIGYVSGEFRSQATSLLLVGVLEMHDTSRFDVYAFDSGYDDESETRRRIEGAVPNLVDIARLSDERAFQEIAGRQIDILINLNGYFGTQRTGLFAMRPAPIQVNYLGFPGTLGAPFMDYIIADNIVIPKEHEPHYSEKVVRLPHSYQANDNLKAISDVHMTRRAAGLPETGIVFCCFNNNYKIVPRVFDCWMRILKRVEGSVLWLLGDNEDAVSNIRREAAARGVEPSRIAFAERVSLAEHLGRHRLADIFLDTLPYNAHTTASDALWSGLPVLTQIGGAFPGRVAASLLSALGMNELITSSDEEYENLAVSLATDPSKLALIRTKLKSKRLAAPLFNTGLYVRNLERSYEVMYRRHESGQYPDSIDLSA